ncbi:hypothetical protein SSYRP_v1c05610 [Spiroplasma syrphidicola EA-1]|uniref:Uncharacterized protein n=1 Tax=Spiroplasma syrphidicola EA-1 TaxID=1276229 RepID=R4ULS0_9MOLU|nr:PQQ-binding-like beta-propeller repeat protein [Spiroplasma syrphidicola]AGM26151.1 hypothetical protein SSYRP_v1c05610 [Spiroplasma syrphidicola EA-1]
MKNKMQVFYDNMCTSCQQKFKKVVSAVKKNILKDLDDLELFKCNIDKNHDIDEDNGVIPVAFIFCKHDSYAFFWKEDLYNGDGSPKLNMVNNVITLSQATIERIKEKSTNQQQLAVIKKEKTELIASKLINENSNSLKNHFGRQMLIMNRQHLLHMSKIKKLILSLGLGFILIIGVVAGTLGWYFTRIENKIAGSQSSDPNWRIDLAEVLTKRNLGPIPDNREETILNAAVAQNNNLKKDDLYLKNIKASKASVFVKSSSNIYLHNSSVEVNYLPELITLATDVKKVNFPKTVTSGTSEELLDIVKGSIENADLVTSNVKIENFNKIGDDVLQVDLTVIENSKIYLNSDVLKLYFSQSNRKLLSEVLTDVNLEDILNKKEDTIINKIGEKNPEVNLKAIEVEKGTILNSSAFIQVSTKYNEDYILDTDPIQVNYRVFNKDIGTVISSIPTTDSTEFNDATSGNGILYLDSIKKILVGTNTGLYLLNSDGTFKSKINDEMGDDNSIKAIGKLNDNTILVSTGRQTVWHLHSDGSVINQEKIQNSYTITSFLQLEDGTILAGGYNGAIYQLNKDGKVIATVQENLGVVISSLVKLSNNTILAGGWKNSIGGRIFQLTMAGKIIKKVGDFKNGIYSIIELKDETILATSMQTNYQLNDDGTVKEQVEAFRKSAFGTVQLPNGDFFMLSVEASVYKLRTE